MTKTEALKALLERVEAGDDNLAVLEASCKSEIMFGHAGLYLHVVDAYQGSLDAAKALHEEVLPGWGAATGFDYYTGMCRSRARVSKLGENYASHIDASSSHSARAWLIAILKALIAIEEQEA